MKMIKSGTKEAERIMNIFFSGANKGSIYTAYGRCSATKKEAWEDIARRARATEGYNNDLRVTSANCHFFSTIYSYTTADGRFIVYDTAGGTKCVKIEES